MTTLRTAFTCVPEVDGDNLAPIDRGLVLNEGSQFKEQQMKVKVMHGVDNGVNIPTGGAKAASEITCAASSAAIYLKGRTMDFEIDVSSAPPDEPRGISLAESPDGNLGLTICDGEHYVAIVLCERIVLSETLAALAN